MTGSYFLPPQRRVGELGDVIGSLGSKKDGITSKVSYFPDLDIKKIEYLGTYFNMHKFKYFFQGNQDTSEPWQSGAEWVFGTDADKKVTVECA